MYDEAAVKKMKDISISISPDEIVGSELYRNKDYRYANVGVKRGDNEYMRITYEWQGDTVPDFVMGIMSWMQANEGVIKKTDEEFTVIKERL